VTTDIQPIIGFLWLAGMATTGFADNLETQSIIHQGIRKFFANLFFILLLRQ